MTTGTLWQLAAMQDMPSVPTLRLLIRERPDFPVIRRGTKGTPYIIDLDAAAAFVRSCWADARRFSQPKRPRAVNPGGQLSLFGGAADDTPPAQPTASAAGARGSFPGALGYTGR